MSTLRVNTLQNTAGTGQPAMVGAAKAWVNFNGTGTVAIRAAFNVSSITDNGAGTYAINFTTPLEDANYSMQIAASLSFNLLNIFSPAIGTGAGGSEVAPSTTSCSMYIATSNAGTFDPKYVQAVVFR